MEPQYNPAVEAQALDRIHRLGQKREVVCVRYIMKNSFEEKVVNLQQKKVELADMTLSGKKLTKEQQLDKLKVSDGLCGDDTGRDANCGTGVEGSVY